VFRFSFRCAVLMLPLPPVGSRKKNVDKTWAAADVEGQFNKTGWGKKIAARKAKAVSSDFDRFKTMVASKEVRLTASFPSCCDSVW